MLLIMCNPFQRVGPPLVAFFDPAVIDLPFFQYLPYLAFINMATIHTAAGMFTEYQAACPIKLPGFVLILIFGKNCRHNDPILCSRFFRSSTTLVLFDIPKK